MNDGTCLVWLFQMNLTDSNERGERHKPFHISWIRMTSETCPVRAREHMNTGKKACPC